MFCSKVAQDVCENMQALTKGGVRLINEIGKDVPHVNGDSGRISQIMTNLIGVSVEEMWGVCML